MALNDVTEFTHPELPGLIGLTWGGQAFTVFASRESADRAAQIIQDSISDFGDPAETGVQVVTRSDGKFLIATIDRADGTFFYADARIPA